MLSRYDIVLMPFPFTDGPNAKPRPALVVAISERHQDVLLAFISNRPAAGPAPLPAKRLRSPGSGLPCSAGARHTAATGVEHRQDPLPAPFPLRDGWTATLPC